MQAQYEIIPLLRTQYFVLESGDLLAFLCEGPGPGHVCKPEQLASELSGQAHRTYPGLFLSTERNTNLNLKQGRGGDMLCI